MPYSRPDAAAPCPELPAGPDFHGSLTSQLAMAFAAPHYPSNDLYPSTSYSFDDSAAYPSLHPTSAGAHSLTALGPSHTDKMQALLDQLSIQQLQLSAQLQENQQAADLAALLASSSPLASMDEVSMQLALAALQGTHSPPPLQQQQQGNTRTGPMNNPLYKTELCRSWEETSSCRYGTKCQFAHGQSDLRPVSRHPRYKTEVCRTFVTTGTCPYGTRCRFIHQNQTLSQLRIANQRADTGSANASTGSLQQAAACASPSPLAPSPVSFDAMLGSGSNGNGYFNYGLASEPTTVPSSPYPPSPYAPSASPGLHSHSTSPGAPHPDSAPPPLSLSQLAGALGMLGLNGSHLPPLSAANIPSPRVEGNGYGSPLAGQAAIHRGLVSAPATPTGLHYSPGPVRRVASDTNLANDGTPTAKRLPIFASLAEEGEAVSA